MSTAIHEPPQVIRVGRLVPVPRKPRKLEGPRAEPPAPKSCEVRLLLFLGLGGAACLAGLALAGFLLMPPGSRVQGAEAFPQAIIAAALPAPEKPVPQVLPAPVSEPPVLLPEPVLVAAIPEPEPAPQPVLLASVPPAAIAAAPVANLLPVKPEPVIVQEPKKRAACDKFGTRIVFLLNPPDAFKKAQEEKKPVFFVHLSGNFEDKEFT